MIQKNKDTSVFVKFGKLPEIGWFQKIPKLSYSLAVSSITDQRTNTTKKKPRGSNELAERSLSSEFRWNRFINARMAADLVKILGSWRQNRPLAAQWLVEKKTSLNEKGPDSRKLHGRAGNAVFSWLVVLEIGRFTKKLELFI